MATRLWTPEQDLPSALVEHWDANSGVTPGSTFQWVGKFAGIVSSQSTSAQQPAFSSTALNGQPGLTFSGGQQLAFTPTGFPSGSAASTIAVSASATSSTSYKTVFAYGSAGNGLQRDASISNGYVEYDIYGGSGYGVQSSITWSGLDRFAILSQPAGATPTISIYADGTTPPYTGSLNNTPNTTLSSGLIGNFIGSNLYWSGIVQQLLLFNRVLTDSERQQLEGWESWYTGKNGANLPSSHPYKSAAPTVTTGGIIVPRRRPLLLMAS